MTQAKTAGRLGIIAILLLSMVITAVARPGSEASKKRATDASKIRAAAEKLVTEHLDVQLERLRENGLASTPEFAEVEQLRSQIATLASGPMQEVESLLNQAVAAKSADQARALIAQANHHGREIIVALVHGRHVLTRRLQRVRTAEDVSYLLSLQEKNLSLISNNRAEVETLTSIQQTITQLITELQQSLQIASSWDDWQAPRSREASTLLSEIDVARLSSRAVDEIGEHRWDDARQTQLKILSALQAVEQILEGIDGSALADRNAAIRLVEQLIRRQAKIRDQTRTLHATDEGNYTQLGQRQTRIHDELMRLEGLARQEATLSIPIATARDSAFNASAMLVQNRVGEALLHQAELSGLLQLLHLRLTKTERPQSKGSDEDAARAAIAQRIGAVARLTEVCERLFAIERDLSVWATEHTDRIFDSEGELQRAYAQRQARKTAIVDQLIQLLKQLEVEPPPELIDAKQHLEAAQQVLEKPRTGIEGEAQVLAGTLAVASERGAWLLETAARALRESHRQLSKQLSQLAQDQISPVAAQQNEYRAELRQLEQDRSADASEQSELELDVARSIVRCREIERDEELAYDMVLAAMDQAEARRAIAQAARELAKAPLEKMSARLPKHRQLAKAMQNGIDQFSEAQIDIGRKTWQIAADRVALPKNFANILEEATLLSASPEKTVAAAAQLKASKMGTGLIPQTPRRTAEMLAGRAAISRMALLFGDNPKAKTQMSVGASGQNSQAPQQKAAEKPTESSKQENERKGQGKARGSGKGKAQGKGEQDGQGEGQGRGSGVGQGNASGSTDKSQSGKASSAAPRGGGAGGGNADDNTDNEGRRQSGPSQNTAGSNAGTREGDTAAGSGSSQSIADEASWQNESSKARSSSASNNRSGRQPLPSGWRDRLREFFEK